MGLSRPEPAASSTTEPACERLSRSASIRRRRVGFGLKLTCNSLIRPQQCIPASGFALHEGIFISASVDDEKCGRANRGAPVLTRRRSPHSRCHLAQATELSQIPDGSLRHAYVRMSTVHSTATGSVETISTWSKLRHHTILSEPLLKQPESSAPMQSRSHSSRRKALKCHPPRRFSQ